MLGVAPWSSRITLKVPLSSGRSGKTRHTSPLLMTGRGLPERAVSDSTAWPAVEVLGAAITGGIAATGGCVNGAGKLGVDAGPDGGARLIAPPDGSGTDAGGTGGGRSVNICAETTAGIPKSIVAASMVARAQ